MNLLTWIKLHGSIIISKILIVIVCFVFIEKYHTQNQLLTEKVNSLEQKFSKKIVYEQSEQNINNMIKKLRPNLDSGVLENYSYLINKYCPENIQKHMVAIFEQESGYNSSARNNDDWGLGQINGRTWQKFFKISNKESLYNPVLNIKFSCKILEMAYSTHYDKHNENFYAYYHSWNSKPQKDYKQRIERILKKLEE